MLKALPVLMAALVAFAIGLTAFDDDAAAGHRSRRNAAIGIGAGVAALAIIAAANSRKAHADEDDDGHDRRHRHPYYGHSGGGMSCGRLLRKCNNGNDWACEKYETGGCTE